MLFYMASVMLHFFKLLECSQQQVGSHFVTVKSVRNCNFPDFAFDGIIYQTLIRSFLMKFCINKIQVQIWAGWHWFFTFILCFWGLMLSFLGFFSVLCKRGGHFEVGRSLLIRDWQDLEKNTNLAAGSEMSPSWGWEMA